MPIGKILPLLFVTRHTTLAQLYMGHMYMQMSPYEHVRMSPYEHVRARPQHTRDASPECGRAVPWGVPVPPRHAAPRFNAHGETRHAPPRRQRPRDARTARQRPRWVRGGQA